MEQHPLENLPAYALGSLEPDEAASVRQHLAKCDTCRDELESFAQTAELLIHAVPVVEPPAALGVRLQKTIRTERTYRWFERLLGHWPRLVPTVSVAILLLVIVSGGYNLLLMRQLESGPAPGLAELQLARLAGTEAMPAATGVLMVAAEANEGVLLVTDMQPLDSGQQYQLWLIRDGLRTSGGVFTVSAQGDARLVVAADLPLDRYVAFGVTIEPYGGSPGPTGPKVLGGTI